MSDRKEEERDVHIPDRDAFFPFPSDEEIGGEEETKFRNFQKKMAS